MTTDINLLVHECEICCLFLLSQGKEPIIPGTSATGPMTDVGSDLFQIRHSHFIVLVDCYSNFPFVEKVTKLSSTATIKVLTHWLNTFGWPEHLRSDNGPQYCTKFYEFCQEHNIVHENYSPHYPQSNGLSESAFKQMKFLLKKANENLDEFSSRLLEFRTHPMCL